MKGRSGGPGDWKPSAREKGRLWLGFGLVFAALAVARYVDTSEPSRSGRWSWLDRLFVQAFGADGDVVVVSLAAVAAILYGILLLRRVNE